MLAGAILGWTLIAWGGRLGLLTGGEDGWAWVRIGGSMLIGSVAALFLVVPRLLPLTRPVVYLFAAWSVLVWTRSVIAVWAGSGSTAFKLVHTALALGFYIIAGWAVTAARGNPVAAPDERHGEQEREGESARLTEG